MSDQVSTAFVQQYTTNVQLLLQQRGSKLRQYLMSNSYTGKAAKAVEQIGSVVAEKRTSRHSDTPLINTPHDARWIHPSDYRWADLIDDEDKLRMLIDPQSSYAINGAYAIGRAMDDVIIAAALGTSYTGENGTTQTAFDTSSQQIASGSAGLTVTKLREAFEILQSNEVDMDNDPLVMIINSKQNRDLLESTEIASSDYNTTKVLTNGKVDSFMGFKFVHCERLGVDGSSDRRVIAFAKSGMHFGLWNDINTSIKERADKNDSTQVLVKGTFGATRSEEGKVVEILCTE